MELKEIFSRLGLGKHTDEIYQCLLESKEPMLVTHIAAFVGVARAEIYREIAELLDKNFVRKVLNGKRIYYEAESPRRIDEEFKKVSRRVSAETEQSAIKKEKDLPKHTQHLRGFSGIREVFDDVVSHTPRGDKYYRYTSERDLEKVNRYLSPTYRAVRDRKKLERLVISSVISGAQKRSRLERFIKFIPSEAEAFDQNIIQLIYGDRSAFINLNTEEAFIIEDKALADFQKVIFMQLYKKL